MFVAESIKVLDRAVCMVTRSIPQRTRNEDSDTRHNENRISQQQVLVKLCKDGQSSTVKRVIFSIMAQATLVSGKYFQLHKSSSN